MFLVRQIPNRCSGEGVRAVRLKKFVLCVVVAAVMLPVGFMIGCTALRQPPIDTASSQMATGEVSLVDTATEAGSPEQLEPHGRYPGKPIQQFLDHMEWSESHPTTATITEEHYLMALDATIRIVKGRKEHPEWRWKATAVRFMNWYSGQIKGRSAWRKYDKLLAELKKAGYQVPEEYSSATWQYDQMISSLERDGFKEAAKEYY